MPVCKTLTVSCLFSLLIYNTTTGQPNASQRVNEALQKAKQHMHDSSCISYLLQTVQVAEEEYDVYGKGLAYQQLGNYYYSRKPDTCISYQLKAYELLMQAGDKKYAAICLHSIAFTYDEMKHDAVTAVSYTERSIIIHKESNDTLEIANMYKYLGNLKATAGKYQEAKNDVHLAMQYFHDKNYEPGIAVSNFDMALVFGKEKNIDSALFYLGKSKEYWVKQDNKPRIFNVNNQYCAIYLLADMHGETLAMLRENEQLTEHPQIFFTDRLTFYSNCKKFYKKQNDANISEYYNLKYNNLKDSLMRRGIQID